MKVVKDRLITEDIPISKCEPGDYISIRSKSGYPRRSALNIVIIKIKPIHKSLVQIKYRSQYSFSSSNVVQKMDLPSHIFVERTRKANPSDGTVVKKVAQEILTS